MKLPISGTDLLPTTPEESRHDETMGMLRVIRSHIIWLGIVIVSLLMLKGI